MHSVLSTRVLLHARGAASSKELDMETDVRFASFAHTDLNATSEADQGQSENHGGTTAQPSVEK